MVGTGAAYDFSNSRWQVVDDDPISEPGYWATFQQTADVGFAANQGWAVYQGSNAWGNYPADNALSGTYLMYDGEGGAASELRGRDGRLDEFIIEADVFLHDNDGIGFVFGFRNINEHFTAVEINDQWPQVICPCVPPPILPHLRTGSPPENF